MTVAKCAIYVRASLPGQDISTQIMPLRRLVVERGLQVVAEYADIGVSGTRGRMRGLDSLTTHARLHRFSVVLVESFDRIARSTKHFLQLLVELHALGIGFISAKEGLDTTGPEGGPVMSLVGAIAQLDGALTRERIRHSMALRRLQGFRLGRKPLDVDREAIVRDRLSGMSLTMVAKRHRISRGSVVRLTKQAKASEAVPVDEFRTASVQAPAECFA